MVDAGIGFVIAPIDQGVRNVGGRDGAAEGAEALFSRLQAEGLVPKDAPVERVAAANGPSSLEADLGALSDAVASMLERGHRPLVLGGDHGTTFATVRGAARRLPQVGVLYLDVHLDMRPYEPVHTSGSSFRRLVEEGIVAPEHVVPIGIEEPDEPQAPKGGERSSFEELSRWADEQGVSWTSIEEVRGGTLAEVVQARLHPDMPWCVSFDVDCLDRAFAPGVSAPGDGRFTPEELAPALEAAFERAHVLDVVEFAPRLDEGGRTLDTIVELLAPLLDRTGPG